MVSTSDSESGNPSSNLGWTSLELFNSLTKIIALVLFYVIIQHYMSTYLLYGILEICDLFFYLKPTYKLFFIIIVYFSSRQSRNSKQLRK